MLQNFQKAEFIERIRCINCGHGNLIELSHGNFSSEPLAGYIAADPWGENPAPYLVDATWSLVKCSECTQVFHRRILNEEWNERRFSKWMSAEAIIEFESRLGAEFPRKFNSAVEHIEHILRIEFLTRSIRGSSPVRVLDFGCGFGRFLEACKHFGFEVSGVDRSIGRRSEALIEIYPTLDDMRGQQFHAITLFEVLEHLDDPADALAKLSLHLVSGGILILETPNCAGVSDIVSQRDYHLVHPLEHINAFTHDTLKSIAERAGFKNIGRGPAFVTAETARVAKRIAKHALHRDGLSTQLYFRK